MESGKYQEAHWLKTQRVSNQKTQKTIWIKVLIALKDQWARSQREAGR